MTESSGYSDGYTRFTGTKGEVLAELQERLQGGHAMGHSEEKLDRLRDAIRGVQEGSFAVKVGSVIYSVAGASTPGAVADAGMPNQRDEKADFPVVEA